MNTPSWKMRSVALISAVLVFAGGTLTSCNTIADAKASITGDPNRKLRSGICWNTQVPEIYLKSREDERVYFNMRNVSGEAPEDFSRIRTAIKRTIQSKGWILVPIPDEADFTIRGDLHFIGENPNGSTDGKGLLNTVTAAAVGIGTGVLVADATDSGIAGGVAGAVVGATAYEGMNNASRVVEWTVVMNFYVSERSEGNQKRIDTYSNTNQDDDRGTSDGIGTRTSNRNDGESTSQNMVREQNQYDHAISVTGWANKIRCDREEAIEIILPKLEYAIGEILPDAPASFGN
jgi:hypothetical protein